MSLAALHASNQVKERDLHVVFKFRLCQSESDEDISRCRRLVCPSVAPRLVWYSSGRTLTKRTLLKDLLHQDGSLSAGPTTKTKM